MAITVSELSIAPVKGLRVMPVEEIEIAATGPVGDRGYVVVDASTHALALTSRNRSLRRIAPSLDPDSGELALEFPGGRRVAELPRLGDPATTAMYDDREVSGRLVEPGALSEALSKHLRRPVLLMALDDTQTRADDFPVTLMSRASLDALAEAPALDGATPDGRRFRMTITVDGVDAWEEHGWGDRELEVGEATLRGVQPVGRCSVTTHHPESGDRGLPVLKALAELRGKRDVTFGIWCRVLHPGRVTLGDRVSLRG